MWGGCVPGTPSTHTRTSGCSASAPAMSSPTGTTTTVPPRRCPMPERQPIRLDGIIYEDAQGTERADVIHTAALGNPLFKCRWLEAGKTGHARGQFGCNIGTHSCTSSVGTVPQLRRPFTNGPNLFFSSVRCPWSTRKITSTQWPHDVLPR